MMNDCDCQILNGGWCDRHHCQKTPHWVMLCRTHPGYFGLWEDGRGPGQVEREMPPLLKEAWNVAAAVLAFVANPGFVDAQTYHTRLSACNRCDKRVGNRCSVCGCFLAIRARGRAWECPEKKWLAVEKKRGCGCGK